MATFPSISPTYGMRKTTAPNNRIVKFADGYYVLKYQKQMLTQ
jgi:hypothetical protein